MVSALIVAAGKGERLPGALAKQYLPLSGRPVLCRTLEVFAACAIIDDIFLVVPQKDFVYCRETILPQVARDVTLVAGGDRRQDSVFNGLRAMSPDRERVVVIHDGVRPFVTCRLIQSCLDGIRDADGCIAAVPASDTLKAVDKDGRITGTIDRAAVWLAQTPQAFRYGVLLEAHQQAAAGGWRVTDDAALLERLGRIVRVVSGSAANIKITTPADLRLAGAMTGRMGMEPTA
ncbi:MAG: 2-C-methyl-D-erythritol 4-phosphate cytidylyltransferase [Thermodesulfobacteriota bacterium]